MDINTVCTLLIDALNEEKHGSFIPHPVMRQNPLRRF